MFEVGFSELVMTALVALLVIGPEKLPKVARMAGFWLGKAKRTVDAVKQEISEEFQAEELRQALQKQAESLEFKELVDETRQDFNRLNPSRQHPEHSTNSPPPKQDEQQKP